MIPPRARRWILAAIGLAGAASLILLGLSRTARNTLRLPDGRVVRIQAVTYGTNHLFTDGPFWVKVARPFLSAPRRMAFGLRTFTVPTPRPSMILWTEWSLPSTNSGPARAASLRARSGIESEPIGATMWGALAGTPSARRVLTAWQFSNFPRGDRQFELHWYDRDASFQPIHLGRLAIDNPAPRDTGDKFPAAPLPQSVVHESTRFTLEAAGVGRPTLSARAPMITGPRKISPGGHLVVSMSIDESGRPSDAWEPRQVIAGSPEGNWFEYGAPRWSKIGPGKFHWAFDDVFWPSASGWRFQVQFVRKSGFEPGQLWTAPALRVPLKGQDVQQPVKAIREGLEIYGLMARLIPSGVAGFNLDFQPNAHLVLQFDRPRESTDVRLTLAGVVDDQGRSLRHTSGAEVTASSLMADLAIPEGVENLTPTFAIHRGIEVEFHVQPTEGKSRTAK